MLPEDDQPVVHEIGNRRYLVAPVEPGVETVSGRVLLSPSVT